MPRGRRRQPGEGEVTRDSWSNSGKDFRQFADTAPKFTPGVTNRPFKDISDENLSNLRSGARRHLGQTFGGLAAGVLGGGIATIASGSAIPAVVGLVGGLASLRGFGGGGDDRHDRRIDVSGELVKESKERQKG